MALPLLFVPECELTYLSAAALAGGVGLFSEKERRVEWFVEGMGGSEIVPEEAA